MRTCPVCGGEVTTDNKRALYCGNTCRAKASTARNLGLPAPAPRSLTVVPAETPAGAASSVVGATKAELDQAGRRDTALGQAALALAGRIDAGMDTGSSLAAAVKQLQATLAAATAGAEGAGLSRLDQMRARRDQKRHA